MSDQISQEQDGIKRKIRSETGLHGCWDLEKPGVGLTAVQTARPSSAPCCCASSSLSALL